jgi:hypothetical protein
MHWGFGNSISDCPWFIREGIKEITCVGVEVGTLSTYKFDSEEEKIAFQKKKCFPGCERCFVAKELERLSK